MNSVEGNGTIIISYLKFMGINVFTVGRFLRAKHPDRTIAIGNAISVTVSVEKKMQRKSVFT